MPFSAPKPITEEDITDALRILGTSDSLCDALNRARVLLETQPPATLTPLILSLWETEMALYRKRRKQSGYVLSAIISALVLFTLLRVFGTYSRPAARLLTLITYLPLLMLPFHGKQSEPTPIHRGLIRFLTLRPQAAFVPLLVDTLSVASSRTPINQEEIRAVLTRYLPVWCEQDHTDLAPTQKKILLNEITEVTGSGSVWTRPLKAPRVEMPLADADFALAAIASLRRCRVSDKQDDATRRTLSHLTAPVSASDPRHEVHQAAQTLTAGQGH